MVAAPRSGWAGQLAAVGLVALAGVVAGLVVSAPDLLEQLIFIGF